ncbi:MAG: flagellar biosynthesis protein FlhF, partial [Rhodocyclales bacterium]|nr:flagellar biosynthesis protein FlhF [Rhodocyclales bacterium]
MNVKRYFATTAREALRLVKAELGADAIVLSNRSVEGGVEIMAMPAEEVQGLQRAAGARPAAPAPRPAPVVHADDDFTVSLSGGARKPAAA